MMEVTFNRMKEMIGDQAIQISILQSEKTALMAAYTKLKEENDKLNAPTEVAPNDPLGE